MSILQYSNRGFKVKATLQHWGLLLEEWLLAIERYCRVYNGDAPWWYKEETNTSILAGAAWRCGWLALTEVPNKKSGNTDNSSLGKTDLFLVPSIDFGTDGGEYIEVKFQEGDSGQTETIKSALNTASKDAARNEVHSLRCRRIGLCFYRLASNQTADSGLQEDIAKLLNNVNELDHHAFAWCFPRETRKLKGNPPGDQVFPGLLIVARLVIESKETSEIPDLSNLNVAST